MRWFAGVLLALLVVLAGCAQAPSGDLTETPTTERPTDGATVTPTATESTSTQRTAYPADPSEDVLGWENGYWYNETITVDQSDGLNDSEMETVVARAMARVEYVRGLEFEETVPVEIQTREEFSAEQENRTLPEDRRLFDNVKFEALFMINESTDSIAVQNRNSGTAVGGYYSPSEKRIVVVSENTTSPRMNEITLSQELFHALQDQHFNLSSYDQSTRERHNAIDGIIEGDGNYVDYLYEQRCNDEWEGECLLPLPGDGGSSGQLANFGPYLLKFHPYSDGPAFVQALYEERGWEAINEVYETPPASTEQLIHPEKYPDERPRTLTVEDRTGDGWTRLEVSGRPDFAELGEAGLFSMFMYPAYETGGASSLIPIQDFFNADASGNLDAVDPLNYEHRYTAGWDGDHLVMYERDDGATGYVWKLAWDSESDAEEFLEGYREMLNYRNANEVDGRANTWVIAQEDDFSGAYYLHQEGDTVVIVRAPSVDNLSEVRQGSAPRV